MKFRFFSLSLLLVILSYVNLSASKYAGELFQMGVSVRNLALGRCGVADYNSASLAYWNPALLNLVENNRYELMHAEEYNGLLTYDTASLIWGRNIKLALVVTRIGIDDIPLTALQNPEDSISFANRPYKYKSVNNSDFVVYAGISRKIGNFNLGLTPKLAYRHLAEENGFGFGADLSTYYEVNSDLLVALRLRDFFTTQILWANGSHEIVSPGLDLEANYHFLVPLLQREANFLLGIESHTDSRNYSATMSLAFLSIDLHAGLAVRVHPHLELLLGYDIDHLTSGLSLFYRNWLLNYAFEYNPELDNSHRISLGRQL